MNRRRFVVIAISTGAAGAALAADGCSTTTSGGNPPAPMPVPGTNVLKVQYAVNAVGGKRFRGRTYNGRTYGPIVYTKPGEMLNFKIVNLLPPNPRAKVPKGPIRIPAPRDAMEAMDPHFDGATQLSTQIDDMNDPHDFNTTNLHVHGIQTVPHLFDPIGTSNPMAPMIEIQPGETFSYGFPIPSDHPSGLHWYHPHKHGSTDVQVSNGMAGLIVVRGPIDEVPEIAAAREFFMVSQTLDVNPSKTDSSLYEREYLAYKTPKEGGYNFGTDFTMLTTNGKGICWVDNNKGTYEALPLPEFQVRPGEVVRWRFLNGTNYWSLFLALPGFEAWQIGFDGVNTLKPIYLDMSGDGVTTITPGNMFSSNVRLAMAANRIELLLRAPKTPGTYTMSAMPTDGIDFTKRPKLGLANFVVSGSPTTGKIPTSLPVPSREYPVITEKDIVARRKFVFSQGTVKELLTGFGFKINDQLYDVMRAQTYPKVGTCEEWRIENSTPCAHPFHLHENSFQLIALNDRPNDPMEVWDTFMIPPKVGGTNGSITIRVRFVYWTGKTVFHCHILPHEDTGMMQNIVMT